MGTYSSRKYLIIVLVIIVSLVLLIKLFSMQILDPGYKQFAEKNVLRRITLYPTRGLIYDRNKELLVYNEASYDLLVTPRELSAFDTTLFCALLKVEKADLIASLEKAKDYSWYKPSIIVKQITSREYASLQEQLYKFPGFYVQTRTLRKYPHEIAAHTFGYIGEVGPTDLKRDKYYTTGDYIGASGLEKNYEQYLRGEKGVKFMLFDVHNREQGAFESGKLDTIPVKGKDIVSTLDLELQKYGEYLMNNKAGSIVAIEPATGEILCLVTSPNYKPSLMVGRQRGTNFKNLMGDTIRPLFNRALSATYPPGSPWKIVNALIGLQERVITPRSRYMCVYGYHYGNRVMKCHHDHEFELTGSIAESCNAYYAHLFDDILNHKPLGGVRLAYDAWRDHAISFGFNTRLSHELREEVKGLIPSSDWYERAVFKGSRWRSSPIISISIGQGEILSTPIQLANFTAILANHGYYYTPHLVKEIEGSEIDKAYRVKQYSSIDTMHYEKVMEGMEMVLEPGGTAYDSKVDGISICGKTGTAQNPHGHDHSLFVAFAPRENPQIAIAVVVENGVWGSRYAAPISTLMIEKYLNDTISSQRLIVEKTMHDANLLYPGKPNYLVED